GDDRDGLGVVPVWIDELDPSALDQRANGDIIAAVGIGVDVGIEVVELDDATLNHYIASHVTYSLLLTMPGFDSRSRAAAFPHTCRFHRPKRTNLAAAHARTDQRRGLRSTLQRDDRIHPVCGNAHAAGRGSV